MSRKTLITIANMLSLAFYLLGAIELPGEPIAAPYEEDYSGAR